MRYPIRLLTVASWVMACAASVDCAGGATGSSSGQGGAADSGDVSSGGAAGGDEYPSGGANGGGPGSGGATGGAPPGAPSPPLTVEDLITLANSLPRPVTLAAFISALPHPLALSATSSQLSLQPAVDADNPRIFVVIGTLVLSVVPAGPQVDGLEIGDMFDGKMTPAHISFPITSPLSLADPYAAVLDASGARTVCARCHQKAGPETQIAEVSGIPVFADSQRLPLRPFDVPVTTLMSFGQDCDPTVTPERCDIFNALLQPGTPSQYDF